MAKLVLKQIVKAHGPLLLLFISMGPYGRKNFKRYLFWKCTTGPPPNVHAYSWWGGVGVGGGRGCVSLPKLFKELCNLKFLIFAIFFSFSLTWDHMMRVKFQITSPLKVRIRFTPQNSCTCILLSWVSTKIVKRIVKFKILDFWPVVCSSFGRLTWESMGNYKMCDILQIVGGWAKRG